MRCAHFCHGWSAASTARSRRPRHVRAHQNTAARVYLQSLRLDFPDPNVAALRLRVMYGVHVAMPTVRTARTPCPVASVTSSRASLRERHRNRNVCSRAYAATALSRRSSRPVVRSGRHQSCRMLVVRRLLPCSPLLMARPCVSRASSAMIRDVGGRREDGLMLPSAPALQASRRRWLDRSVDGLGEAGRRVTARRSIGRVDLPRASATDKAEHI